MDGADVIESMGCVRANARPGRSLVEVAAAGVNFIGTGVDDPPWLGLLSCRCHCQLNSMSAELGALT